VEKPALSLQYMATVMRNRRLHVDVYLSNCAHWPVTKGMTNLSRDVMHRYPEWSLFLVIISGTLKQRTHQIMDLSALW